MSGIKSNADEFKKLAKNPNESPVVMLNLLKFKGKEGQASYARYTKEAGKFCGRGGRKSFVSGKTRRIVERRGTMGPAHAGAISVPQGIPFDGQ